MNIDKLVELHDAIEDYISVADFIDETIEKKELYLCSPLDEKSVASVRISNMEDAKAVYAILDAMEQHQYVDLIDKLSAVVNDLTHKE